MIFLSGFLSRAIKSPIFYVLVLVAILLGIWFTSNIFSSIGTFLGFETKDNLKKELVIEKHNVEVLTDVNAGNQVAIQISEGTKVNTVKALETVEKKAEVTTKYIQKVKDTVATKVEEVKVSTATPEEKEAKVSDIRIRGLWDVYCQSNSDAGCPVNVTQPTGV